MLAAWPLLIAVVARLPSCSWESGGAVTVAMNITGFVSPCATDSNSPEKVRSHILVRWGGCPPPLSWQQVVTGSSANMGEEDR